MAKDGYTDKSSGGGISPWVGWGISTLLLLFLNRNSSSSSTSSQQPSKYTEDNVNCIGQPVPVVLGRAMIKNPLVSYYGDFNNEPYTEEYGMHSGLDAAGLLWPFLLNILMALIMPVGHPTQDTDSHGDTGYGTAEDTENGEKFNMLVAALLNLLISLLLYLFTQHLGRTTIQKGFLYYLGWQHIICWTGRNIGIKKLWMNVYDSEIEESTETGVWDNDGNIAWEKDNINGIEAYIDDKEMFGGWDEQGGFTGSVRFYFGNREQPKDPWMIHSMNQDTIEESLRGLTPKYPMYLTCVVSNNSKTGGAYIGKQATIPEMWFEVVNYPSRLYDEFHIEILEKFSKKINDEYEKIVSFMSSQDQTVQDYMYGYIERIREAIDDYNSNVASYLLDVDNNEYPEQELLDNIDSACEVAYNNYPQTNREIFGGVVSTLRNLCNNGYWHLGRLDDDLNPAEAIYEILMNKYWGCGYTEDRIDTDSLLNLGIVCEQERLGVSCLINRTAQANEYVTKILNHINGVKYDDPKTGKLTFKLIRNDYDVSLVKNFNPSNTESCEFSRLDWSETSSATEVTFTDASNKYDTGQLTYNDIANRLITGFYTSKSVEGDYFTTSANAKWLAQMNQLANGYPLSAVNLVTNRYAYDVTIGDPIKISWEPYGISQAIYRVTDIDYSGLTDGKISVTAVEDVFGFDKLEYSEIDAPQWTDPSDTPHSIGRYMFMEDPYETARNMNTYIYAYASKPSAYTVYWDVWRQEGSTYVKSSKSMLWSIVGKLTYGYLKEFGIDTVGFEFSLIGVDTKDLIDQKIEKIEKYPSNYSVTSGLNLVIVDNEWMSYENIERLPNGHYRLVGVIRGVFDTLPEEHTAESIIYFVENRQNIVGAGNYISEEDSSPVTEHLELRTETRNVAQPFDLSLLEEYTTTRRSEQPSVMANMKYGTDMGSETVYEYDYTNSTVFSGDILFTFNARNKFNNYGILSQLDTDTEINMASDIYNVIQTSCSGIDCEWKDVAYDEELEQNITTDSLYWAKFCEQMGENIKYSNITTFNLLTYNSSKDLYSYDKYTKTIDWRTPRFVGVVSSEEEASDLANSYLLLDGTSVVVPETDINPQIALLLTECPLLIEGTLVTGVSSDVDIKGQDGNVYRLSNIAYRIVGRDDENNPILYKFSISENYIIRSDFTQRVDNYADYWKYNGTNWTKYLI